MKYYVKVFLLFSLFAITSGFSYQYELVICNVFRNDAPYLKEWVDFHIKQGVDHFYLYDNFSTDHPDEVMKEYIDKGIVEIIPWNISHGTHESFVRVQNQAFMDCIRRNKTKVKWCACIDTDEFLFCPDGKNLKKFLKGYKEVQCLCVEWLLYGTSGLSNVPPDEITKQLLLRAPDETFVTNKCIVRPKKVVDCYNCHYFSVQDQTKCMNENKEFYNIEYCAKGTGMRANKKIRINHYFCRDQDYFKLKIEKALLSGRDPEIIIAQEAMSNEIFDDSILLVR